MIYLTYKNRKYNKTIEEPRKNYHIKKQNYQRYNINYQ